MNCLKVWQAHAWLKWETTREAEVTQRLFRDPKQETGVVGRVLYQQRTCARCGRVELRSERARLQGALLLRAVLV